MLALDYTVMARGYCSRGCCLGKLPSSRSKYYSTGHSATEVKMMVGYNIKVAIFGALRFLVRLSWRGY